MSHDQPLTDLRLLMFVGDDYEDLELWYPKLRLAEAGAHMTVAGPKGDTLYKGKHGYPCRSDAAIALMETSDFHGVVIPGGFMPDKLRRDDDVKRLVRRVRRERKARRGDLPWRLDPDFGRRLPRRARYRLARNQRRPRKCRRHLERRAGRRRSQLRLQPQAGRPASLLPGDHRGDVWCGGVVARAATDESLNTASAVPHR